MTPPESAEMTAIKNVLDRLASASAFEVSKTTFDIARFNFNTGNFAMCIAFCERAVELDDPVFATQALLLLAETWRRVGRHDTEINTYKRIAALPNERRKFIDAAQLGVALSRAGRAEEARQHYLASLDLYTDKSGIESNLAELLLTMGKYKECIDWSDRVQALPSASRQVTGRLFKASALFLSGDRKRAGEEFQWLGAYLISTGSVPQDFAWDFGDSMAVLEKIDLASGALVIQVLAKRISFSEFLTKWSAIFPVQGQASANS